MKIICLASLLCTALTPAWSEQLSYNMYGQPGLIDMPTAQSDSDGVLALNQSYFDGTLRTTITAQILPRLSASFRYAGHGKNGKAPLKRWSDWPKIREAVQIISMVTKTKNKLLQTTQSTKIDGLKHS